MAGAVLAGRNEMSNECTYRKVGEEVSGFVIGKEYSTIDGSRAVFIDSHEGRLSFVIGDYWYSTDTAGRTLPRSCGHDIAITGSAA